MCVFLTFQKKKQLTWADALEDCRSPSLDGTYKVRLSLSTYLGGKPWKSSHKILMHTVTVLKFWSLVPCQNSRDKQCRPRSDCFWRSNLIRVFPVCYCDKKFVNSSPDNQYFTWEQKEKSVRNFMIIYRTYWSGKPWKALNKILMHNVNVLDKGSEQWMIYSVLKMKPEMPTLLIFA